MNSKVGYEAKRGQKINKKEKRVVKEETFKRKQYFSIKQSLFEKGRLKSSGILVVSYDITAKKQAHIAKQELLQNMTHDLRTPLTGVIGLVQLQSEGLASLEESKK